MEDLGSLLAQVIATLYAAAVVSEGLIKAKRRRQIFVRSAFLVAVCLGLLAALWTAAGGVPVFAYQVALVGVGAGMAVVVAPSAVRWSDKWAAKSTSSGKGGAPQSPRERWRRLRKSLRLERPTFVQFDFAVVIVGGVAVVMALRTP